MAQWQPAPPSVPVLRSTQPEVTSDASDPFTQLQDVLQALGLSEQPDLAGMIVGHVLASRSRLPDFHAQTAIAILGGVGQAVRQWRAELGDMGHCPLCNRG